MPFLFFAYLPKCLDTNLVETIATWLIPQSHVHKSMTITNTQDFRHTLIGYIIAALNICSSSVPVSTPGSLAVSEVVL